MTQYSSDLAKLFALNDESSLPHVVAEASALVSLLIDRHRESLVRVLLPWLSYFPQWASRCVKHSQDNPMQRNGDPMSLRINPQVSYLLNE